ncbi:MAG: prepilin-type N-terminal cleavage/methylation domain-containing protein [Pseudomonadota bacterium]|nr:hypothetical protein [Pseudomonadales bacterium]MDY6920200.1 prepilin-type N-terminal cleavage/methylation domain-containing protein [Pseudomonadota bacterium]
MKAIRPAVNSQRGFTLVELIIVITLLGVVGVLATTMVGNQMQGYVDTARRAALVAKADGALRQLARDLRNAVPFSVRTNGTAIEWTPIEDFGRYRKLPGSGGDLLDFSAPDSQFDIIGPLPAVGAGNRLVVGNSDLAASGYNLYQAASDGSSLPAGAHVITGTAITPSLAGSTLSLSAPFQFSQDSIASRFYVVSGGASYVCNTGTGELTRYSGYTLQAAQPTNPAAAPLSSASTALLVDSVSACSFGYSAVDALNGIVTLVLTLSDQGESVTLVRFIHVENRS